MKLKELIGGLVIGILLILLIVLAAIQGNKAPERTFNPEHNNIVTDYVKVAEKPLK